MRGGVEVAMSSFIESERLYALDQAYGHASSQEDRVAIWNARREIERLSASEFRWEPWNSGNTHITKKSLVRFTGGVELICAPGSRVDGATHFAVIPPLPEPTPEELDEGAWRKFLGSPLSGKFNDYGKQAFFAGLKAARAAK